MENECLAGNQTEMALTFWKILSLNESTVGAQAVLPYKWSFTHSGPVYV